MMKLCQLHFEEMIKKIINLSKKNWINFTCWGFNKIKAYLKEQTVSTSFVEELQEIYPFFGAASFLKL